MISLLPFVLSLAFAFGGSSPVNPDLGYDAQQMDTKISIRSEEVNPPPPCTSLCKGPEDVLF